MADNRPYRILLSLYDPNTVEAWVNLALNLLPEGGEIRLRGLVTVAEGTSLSEGALQARALRDALDVQAKLHDAVLDETEVRVDYQPMARLLNELQEFTVDLLLAHWAGPNALTGGLSTDDLMAYAPCDVVLICGDTWHEPGPVLLSLRGGPNISLGVRVARALAGDSTITLFHASDTPRAVPDLSHLMHGERRITRIVAAVSGIREGILREAAGHKALVFGASFRKPERNSQTTDSISEYVHQHLKTPLVIVRARNPEELAFHAPRLIVRPQESLSTRVDRWFAENTFHAYEFADLNTLLALKERQGVRISLGLPALNEEETVGLVITTIKSALMDEVPLLDEIVLIDSNSTDNTVAIATDCGIPVYRHQDILPETGAYIGKGEALWKSLHVLTGDIIAWVDTDITNIHPRFVYGLIGPLLKRPHVQYVKGFYNRPIRVGDQLQAYGGGRVTELVARPWFNLFYPELSGIVQPLSGEYAGRRAALESVPFFSGYGVETGLLIDLLDRYGIEAIAQTDLEERVHHNQPLIGLSKMSFAILQVFIARLEGRFGVNLLDQANRSMKLIAQAADRLALDIVEIGDYERPPIITIPAYQTAHSTTASTP